LEPGQETELTASFTMPPGMGGPHLFVIRLKTNDPVEPERRIRIRSNWQ
jgi:hypothetical protein